MCVSACVFRGRGGELGWLILCCKARQFSSISMQTEETRFGGSVISTVFAFSQTFWISSPSGLRGLSRLLASPEL